MSNYLGRNYYDEEEDDDDGLLVYYAEADEEFPKKLKSDQGDAFVFEGQPSNYLTGPEISSPTQHDDGIVADQQRKIETAEPQVLDALEENHEVDYANIELIHNEEDPYGLEMEEPLVKEDVKLPPLNDVIDLAAADENRIDIGPALEDEEEVQIIVSENQNQEIRRHDMRAVYTRSWKIPIIDGEQFYRHKNLRPPPSDNRPLVKLFEQVVPMMVTRRNINEFKKGSKNVYIRLVSPRFSEFWEDLRKQVKAETFSIYARYGDKHLQTVMLPEIMQRFRDGNVMTYRDFYSLLPTGK